MAEELSQAQEKALASLGFESTEKAYTTGHEINPHEVENGSAIRREVLSDQIHLLSFSERDLEFFSSLNKEKANSTVVQYNIQTDWGGGFGNSRFVSEVDISNVTDPQIRRRKVDMKFVSDTKQISLAAQIVDNIADPVKILTESGIVNNAKSIEWAAFYGDADLSDDPTKGSGLQFDGLAKLIDPNNVLDVNGDPLSEDILNIASVMVAKGYGRPTDAYMPLGVQADFVNQYLTRQTQIVSDNGQNVSLGFNVQTFNSAQGPIKLHGSTVMELDLILDLDRAIAPDAPMEPSVEATVNTADKGEFGKRGDVDITNHTYRVIAHGSKATSRASQPVNATVANADDSVELSIKLNAMYNQRVQYVEIYRQGHSTGQFYSVGKVAASEVDPQTGTITFVDRNERLPETVDVFLGEMSPSVIKLFELLPMTRVPLAQNNATITFTILWYGALALVAPKKWVHVKNVRQINVKDAHNNSYNNHVFSGTPRP